MPSRKKADLLFYYIIREVQGQSSKVAVFCNLCVSLEGDIRILQSVRTAKALSPDYAAYARVINDYAG